MNYQQYIELKEELTNSLRLYSLSMHIPTVMALVQSALLLFRVDLHFDYINMFVLDSIFSFAYSRAAEGNYVFAAMFYVAFAVIIGIFIYTSVGVMFFEEKKPAYKLSIFIYAADALLWLGTFSILQFIVHIIILIPMCITVKKHNTLNSLEKSLWG